VGKRIDEAGRGGGKAERHADPRRAKPPDPGPCCPALLHRRDAEQEQRREDRPPEDRRPRVGGDQPREEPAQAPEERGRRDEGEPVTPAVSPAGRGRTNRLSRRGGRRGHAAGSWCTGAPGRASVPPPRPATTRPRPAP